MKSFSMALLILCGTFATAADTPKTTLSNLTNPESVCYGPHGDLYVTEIGEPGKDGDGKVTRVREGKAESFATGLNDPKGIVFFRDALYVTDKTEVIKVDAQGKTSVYMAASAFPKPPLFLNDIAVDGPNGIFLVSDSGNLQGKDGAVFRIDVRLNKIETIADAATIPKLHTPNGVAFDGEQHCLVADFGTGALYRVKFADKSFEQIADGMDGADGLVWDHYGRLFITSWKTGKTFAIPRAGRNC